MIFIEKLIKNKWICQQELFYGQRWTFRSLSALLVLLNYSLISNFPCTQCWPKWMGSFLFLKNTSSDNLTAMYQTVILLRSITSYSATLHASFSSPYTTNYSSALSGHDTLPSPSFENSDWYFLKDSIISSDHLQNIWSDFFCFSVYLLYIHFDITIFLWICRWTFVEIVYFSFSRLQKLVSIILERIF